MEKRIFCLSLVFLFVFAQKTPHMELQCSYKEVPFTCKWCRDDCKNETEKVCDPKFDRCYIWVFADGKSMDKGCIGANAKKECLARKEKGGTKICYECFGHLCNTGVPAEGSAKQ